MNIFLKFTIVLCCLCSNQSHAQEGDWIYYRDTISRLVGFKDIYGNVKTAPKFSSLTGGKIFKNIVPVMEKIDLDNPKNYKTANYYLLKNGSKIGVDSLYLTADFTLDRENEDKIRFRDEKSDKVGFFSSQGKVIIPAIYNDAQPFYNGMALAIKDATRVYSHDENHLDSDCEHWYWKGNLILINDKNEILLENLNFKDLIYIDWYSIKINELNLDGTYQNFITTKGETYSFINLRLEFEKWFYTNFLKYLHDEIILGKKSGWVSKHKSNSKFDKYAWFIDAKDNSWENNKDKLKGAVIKFFDKNYKISISKGDAPLLFDELKTARNI